MEDVDALNQLIQRLQYLALPEIGFGLVRLVLLEEGDYLLASLFALVELVPQNMMKGLFLQEERVGVGDVADGDHKQNDRHE